MMVEAVGVEADVGREGRWGVDVVMEVEVEGLEVVVGFLGVAGVESSSFSSSESSSQATSSTGERAAPVEREQEMLA
jgi:hypothetical protein